MEFDAQVVRQDPAVLAMADKFVFARVTRLNGIDLNVFRFDYDLFPVRWAVHEPRNLLLGIPFSVTLLGILLAVPLLMIAARVLAGSRPRDAAFPTPHRRGSHAPNSMLSSTR